MGTPYFRTLIKKNFPEVIIPDHNFQPKLKAQAGFVRNSVVFYPNQYIYHNELSRNDLMEEFTENFGAYTYGIIVQGYNVQKNIIKYRTEYDTKQSVLDGPDFCDICK